MAGELALEVKRATVRRGQLRVVRDVSLSVERGRCLGLLGLNGAGKSSLLLALAGSLELDSGSVWLDGRDLTSRPSWTRSKQGLVLVPAGRQLFAELSVLDNLLVGGHAERSRAKRNQLLKTVFDHFPVLYEKRRQLARELSGGQQQMVALGRGLMSRPSVLMLDEPSEGLAPIMVETTFRAIERLRSSGSMAILLAEQNASAADMCDSVLVMRDGEVAPDSASPSAADIARSVFE